MRRPAWRTFLTVLIAFGATWAPASALAAPKILLYPLARAFGSPPESELAKCREAFRQFQSTLPTSTVVARPVLVVAAGPAGRTQEWRADLAEQLAQQLSADVHVRCVMSAEPPALPPPVLGRNQMRFAWNEAAQYARLVKTIPGTNQYTLFTEVWAHRDRVAGIHLFLINAAGQITYCRWLNSHQFGADVPLNDGAWLGIVRERLLQDFARTPEQLFPKYGVG